MYDLQPAGFLKWCLRLPSEYEQTRRANTLLWHRNPSICPKITTRSSFNANSILFLSLHRIRFPPAIKCLQKRDTIEMARHTARAGRQQAQTSPRTNAGAPRSPSQSRPGCPPFVCLDVRGARRQAPSFPPPLPRSGGVFKINGEGRSARVNIFKAALAAIGRHRSM